jgi:hypothetical protein
MDANTMIGLVILALALGMGCFLAAVLLAAGEGSGPRAGGPLYGRITRGAFARTGTGQLAESRAHCYYDCMSGFHWNSEWGGLCSEACSVSGRSPRG